MISERWFELGRDSEEQEGGKAWSSVRAMFRKECAIAKEQKISDIGEIGDDDLRLYEDFSNSI